MTKPLTVRQMSNRLLKLIEEGHGGATVVRLNMQPAFPRFDSRDVTYIGPSEWDDALYAWGKTTKKGTVIV